MGFVSRAPFGSLRLFAEHYVANYCPLVSSTVAATLPPQLLPAANLRRLEAACDAHLRRVVSCSKPQWVIGGRGAEGRAQAALAGLALKFGGSCTPARRARPPTVAGVRRPPGNSSNWASGRNEATFDPRPRKLQAAIRTHMIRKLDHLF